MLFTFPIFIHEFNIPHSFLVLKIVDHPAGVGAFRFGEEGRGVLASGKPQKREGTGLLIQVSLVFLVTLTRDSEDRVLISGQTEPLGFSFCRCGHSLVT